MSLFGEKIRKSRLDNRIPLQRVASFLEMDPVLLNQIEMGKRSASKDQVLKLANCLNVDEKNLMTYYLKERILQARINRESEKRLQNLIQELRELDNRQILIRFHKPAPPLTTLIKSIIYYHGDIKAHPFERMLPDGSIKLIFNLRTNKNGEQSSPASKKVWVIGPQKKYTTYQLTSNEENLTVQFATGGFYSMTDIPATEIKNHFIDAEQIFGTSILSLREKFLSCNDTGMIISMIEQYFLKKVEQLNTEYAMVRFIADNISAPLSTLVNKTGYSHKHVIHLFKKQVGISPKQFQRICRFNKSIVDLMAVTGEIDWGDIIFKNGFYDQPHFIREFKEFSGFTPLSYLETGNTCSKLLHMNRAM